MIETCKKNVLKNVRITLKKVKKKKAAPLRANEVTHGTFFLYLVIQLCGKLFIGISEVNDESLRGLSCLFQVYSIISLINLVYGNIRILTVLSKQNKVI